jgi:multicomponent Na+:H+ antiporter subunit E
MSRVSIIVLLWIVYLALTANLEFSNLVVGLIIAAGVAALIRPAPRAFDARRLPATLLALARYLLFVFVDLIQSGLNVARLVLTPALPIRPGLIAIPGQTDNEIAAALSAHAITITPGQMVVEMGEDGVLYTHCLDAGAPEAVVAAAQKTRRELLEKILNRPE